MGLIENLKLEHKAILSLLDDVEALGIGSEEGKKKLLKSKELILAHLHKEDEKLYPALKDLTKVQAVSLAFETDMTWISSQVLRFYCDLEKLGENSAEVEIMFEDVKRLLTERIGREERLLYPLYEEHIAQN